MRDQGRAGEDTRRRTRLEVGGDSLPAPARRQQSGDFHRGGEGKENKETSRTNPTCSVLFSRPFGTSRSPMVFLTPIGSSPSSSAPIRPYKIFDAGRYRSAAEQVQLPRGSLSGEQLSCILGWGGVLLPDRVALQYFARDQLKVGTSRRSRDVAMGFGVCRATWLFSHDPIAIRWLQPAADDVDGDAARSGPSHLFPCGDGPRVASIHQCFVERYSTLWSGTIPLAPVLLRRQQSEWPTGVVRTTREFRA